MKPSSLSQPVREKEPDSYCPREGTDDDSFVSWINILEIEEVVDSELQKKYPLLQAENYL